MGEMRLRHGASNSPNPHNLTGYRAFGNKVFLFMTFDEHKKFGVYDNKFLSQQAFSYYSKAAKTLDDPLEKALAENSYQSYIFARVNKQDSYFFRFGI